MEYGLDGERACTFASDCRIGSLGWRVGWKGRDKANSTTLLRPVNLVGIRRRLLLSGPSLLAATYNYYIPDDSLSSCLLPNDANCLVMWHWKPRTHHHARCSRRRCCHHHHHHHHRHPNHRRCICREQHRSLWAKEVGDRQQADQQSAYPSVPYAVAFTSFPRVLFPG